MADCRHRGCGGLNRFLHAGLNQAEEGQEKLQKDLPEMRQRAAEKNLPDRVTCAKIKFV